ncbi:DNA helicase [Desulfosporosinus sp.]|uniref:type II toxin-antitoxin system RelE/ParE family toxin n=1 Tax=Desulfosporosinus sp. TaxID=157907 RepID=UPI00261B868C|nr:DNA helicase [Desulfosporosinus sp.]MCO5385757.1 DNA helicase [Desulfosporosinus sp.]
MPVIIKTNSFNAYFSLLSPKEQKQTIKALRFLAENPRHPSLHTHKIEGTVFIEAYANMDIRIIFERTNDTIVLRAVGHHDILKNL